MAGMILLSGGAKNDFFEKYDLFASHTHTEEKADGSKEIIQKDLESSEQSYCKGDGWLWNPKKPDLDPGESHFREDKSFVLMKDKRIKKDKFGNKTIEEKAAKTEDSKTLHGTSMIINEPETFIDFRPSLMDNFSSNNDPFHQIGNNKPLLLGDK